MRSRNRFITIGLQIAAMRSLFPQFKYKREKRDRQRPTWIGSLQPTNRSPQYVVKIRYSYPYSPEVWVVSPSIDPNAPHLYGDKSLCLYYPKDRSWHPQEFVAKTIVPWIVEWLALYEIWCLTGEWYGEEAPHTGKKVKLASRQACKVSSEWSQRGNLPE